MYFCYRTTMRVHIEKAFGWDEQHQRDGFLGKWADNTCHVLRAGNQFVGFSWIEESESYFLRLLCIEPRFQQRGLGAKWMHAVQKNAGLQGKSVELRVLKTNSALAFYKKLGFGLSQENDVAVSLVYPSTVESER